MTRFLLLAITGVAVCGCTRQSQPLQPCVNSFQAVASVDNIERLLCHLQSVDFHYEGALGVRLHAGQNLDPSDEDRISWTLAYYLDRDGEVVWAPGGDNIKAADRRVLCVFRLTSKDQGGDIISFHPKEGVVRMKVSQWGEVHSLDERHPRLKKSIREIMCSSNATTKPTAGK